LEDWGGPHKKANRSEKNKKKFGPGTETLITNDISPESSPGAGRRKTKAPHTFPYTRYATQMSVPEQAELEKLKQRINFSDLDQRSIGSDSQGRATAANNKRQLGDNRKAYNCLPLQINTNKSKDAIVGSHCKEIGDSSQFKDLLLPPVSRETLQDDHPFQIEDGRRDLVIDSGQLVSKLVQIRDYITKACSMRDDLVEKNERSANVDRLSELIEHLKEQEKSYMKFLQKMLARENEEEEDFRTIDSAAGSGSVAESTSLNVDTQSVASDVTEVSLSVRIRPRIEDNLGNSTSQGQVSESDVTPSSKEKSEKAAVNGREIWTSRINSKDPGLLSKMDYRCTFSIAAVTETTGSISGLSITSELNEELNDLIQRFHNQLCDSQTQPVPDNRKQAESLSLTREVSRSHNSSPSGCLSEEKVQLAKLKLLKDKKQKMDKLLDELHSLQEQHLNNSSAILGSSHRGSEQRSVTLSTVPLTNQEPTSLAASACQLGSAASREESEDDILNPKEKLRKLQEVHKRLNELRELVHYYEQTSDMITDAVNEHSKNEDDTEESIYDSEQESSQPVTNVRSTPRRGNWFESQSSSTQCGTNNQDRLLNAACEINNRAAVNVRTLNVPTAFDCRYNPDGENEADKDGEAQDEDDEPEEENVSDGSVTSRRSSLADESPPDPEFQQKIDRLLAAKQKLKRLQELVAMVQDEDDSKASAGEESKRANFSVTASEAKEQPNNTRPGVTRSPNEVALNEKAREKFYEAKLQQQQRELQQLQEERKRLIEIQEKIQDLQKACPDLQLSSCKRNSASKKVSPSATSTPATGEQTAVIRTVSDPGVSSALDNELWSEMQRHHRFREELRQRRKQLEALMAEHQKRRTPIEPSSAAVAVSVRSDESVTEGSHLNCRTEKTTATWGGSSQCALDDEEVDDGGYPSDGILQATEEDEEEESETSSQENYSMYPNPSRSQNACYMKEKNRLKKKRSISVDGNYRPSAKSQQQQNVSIQRQENFRWASDLSYTEEKEYWQEQINQLKKQLTFSTNMCQTLMQDQQTLSYLLQTLLTGPYSVMPSNVGSPQVHLLMHQLNQCYSQLAWQQSNVQRLKHMLNDVLHQQQQPQPKSSRKKRDSSGPPPPSPNIYCPFSFPSPPMNSFQMSGIPNYTSMAPVSSSYLGKQCCSLPCLLQDYLCYKLLVILFYVIFQQDKESKNQSENFTYSGLSTCSTDTALTKQKTFKNCDHLLTSFEAISSEEISAVSNNFPIISTTHSLNSSLNRSWRPTEEVDCVGATWINEGCESEAESRKLPHVQVKLAASSPTVTLGSIKQQCTDGNSRRRQFDEASVESFSSMPDPVDPTTVTKTFKSGKASAQASLASKDKTPKSKTVKKRKGLVQQNIKGANSFGLESESVSSASELSKNRNQPPALTEESLKKHSFKTKHRDDHLEKIMKRKKTIDMSSACTRRALHQSNRNACTEVPETGSDFSLFETLRDTIYSEVATLISQNESHPHFLIELFHELQLLNSDYLRQRALYALQDIVPRQVSEKKKEHESPRAEDSSAWLTSNSELTPSESLATTDDETRDKNEIKQALGEVEQKDADNVSMLSTSSNFEPFATDDLGNTVIHLDQALARMREYERMKLEAESNEISEGCCSNFKDASADEEGQDTRDDCPTENICDASNIHCPRIDTQQLDKQIKAIMKEVIPFLKEHMEEICSTHLLTSVRRMVLTLTQQNDESKEFVKFFHKQLGGILQDSLAKFAGRKLKDCGEDLLVEISEVLFNELAFFRLMQDLDNSSLGTKPKFERKNDTADLKESDNREEKCKEDFSPSTEALEDEDKDRDETETLLAEGQELNGRKAEKNGSCVPSDQEEEEECKNFPVSISLSMAESQALTNYGSGEDENEDEEMADFEAGPVDVQTSLLANSETAEEKEELLEAESPKASKECERHLEHVTSVNTADESEVLPELMESKKNEDAAVIAVVVTENETVALPCIGGGQSGVADDMQAENKSSTITPESSLTGSPDTNSPVLVNEFDPGSGNVSQKSDEEDFVNVEDLPIKLSVFSENELVSRMTDEELKNNLSVELVNPNGKETEELAGDSQALKAPDTVGSPISTS
ncbi:pericentriolar material 1 protein, partial [Protopterus annectens]|uniref:pericentriolar material 1 protein n=1 Tax=Protopterus annectens TaxID=7888 RepID=UPI001CFB6CDB